MTRSLLSMMLAPAIAFAVPTAAQGPAPVTVALSNFHIAPATIRLAAGRPVRLVFTNASGSSHNFTAPEFFAHATVVTGPVEHGEVELPGHTSASVTLTPARGTYKAKCAHFGHKMMGMSATIIID
jgi:plastocyanin